MTVYLKFDRHICLVLELYLFKDLASARFRCESTKLFADINKYMYKIISAGTGVRGFYIQCNTLADQGETWEDGGWHKKRHHCILNQAYTYKSVYTYIVQNES